MIHAPVLIAGAGPVGLLVALQLARMGVGCIVAEAEPGLTHDLRAGTFHPPTIEMLEKVGVATRMLELGIKVPRWQSWDLAHGMVAGPDASLVAQPARAIKKAAQKAGLDPAGLDLYEMNEAFASVALVSMDQLGIDDSKVNVNGGAIALGHPIGMSGARIVLHLANELKRRGGGTGAAALCGGGGQGDALIIRVP